MIASSERSPIAADDGMSVIELVVASIIGLMVLTVAYLVFETGMKGFRQVENQTIASRTAAQAMLVMERPIREATGFGTGEMSANKLTFHADINDDKQFETVTFAISGTNLMMSRSATDTPKPVINDIANGKMGVPLFTYFRDVGSPLTSLKSDETTSGVTKIIRITVVTQPSKPSTGAADPPSYTVQTDIYLRNSQ